MLGVRRVRRDGAQLHVVPVAGSDRVPFLQLLGLAPVLYLTRSLPAIGDPAPANVAVAVLSAVLPAALTCWTVGGVSGCPHADSRTRRGHPRLQSIPY